MPVVINPWENINEAHRNLIAGIQGGIEMKRAKQADVRAEKELHLRENQQNVWQKGAEQQQELTGMEIAGRKAEQSALVSATGAIDYTSALAQTMKTRTEQEARKADFEGFKTVMTGFQDLIKAGAPAAALKQYFGAAARMNPRMSDVYSTFDVAQTGETSIPVHSDGKMPLKQTLGLSDEAWQRFGLPPDHVLPEGYYQVVSGPQKAAITPIKAEQGQPGSQPLNPLTGQPSGPAIPEKAPTSEVALFLRDPLKARAFAEMNASVKKKYGLERNPSVAEFMTDLYRKDPETFNAVFNRSVGEKAEDRKMKILALAKNVDGEINPETVTKIESLLAAVGKAPATPRVPAITKEEAIQELKRRGKMEIIMTVSLAICSISKNGAV